jgi:hypothetical protein
LGHDCTSSPSEAFVPASFQEAFVCGFPCTIRIEKSAFGWLTSGAQRYIIKP